MKITSNYVTLKSEGSLTCLQVNHPRASACIALQGAQVLEFAPTGQRPVIWLSEEAAFQPGQSVRGGIPVCWPWFGDFRRNPAAVKSQYQLAEPPAHGWARTVDWQVDDIVDSVGGVTVTLSVSAAALASASIPIVVLPRLQVSVGERLHVLLINEFPADSVVAGDAVGPSGKFSISQALHTYFAVSDINNVAVEGLEGVPYIDTLKDWQEFTDVQPVQFAGETDRIYQGNVADVCLRDEGWQRRIRVRASHSRSLVLWNPHVEKSLRLSQFASDAWRRMVCIETANILSDIVELAPGECHVMQFEVGVEPL